MKIVFYFVIRDRPFNLKGGYGFLFHSEILFRTTQELEYFSFFSKINIRLYDKNSESDYFFSLHQNQNIFFQQHWESEYFFLEKDHNPPPPMEDKWSVP